MQVRSRCSFIFRCLCVLLGLVLVLSVMPPMAVHAADPTDTSTDTQTDNNPSDKPYTGTQHDVQSGVPCYACWHPVLMGTVWHAQYDGSGVLTTATPIGGFYCSPFYTSNANAGMYNEGGDTADWTEAEMSTVLNSCLATIMGSYTRPGLSAPVGPISFYHMSGESSFRKQWAKMKTYDNGGDVWRWPDTTCYDAYHSFVNSGEFVSAVTQEVDRIVSASGGTYSSQGFGFGSEYLVTLCGVDVKGSHYNGTGQVTGTVSSTQFLVCKLNGQEKFNHWAFQEGVDYGIFALGTQYCHMYTGGDVTNTGYTYVLVDQDFNTLNSTSGAISDTWRCPSTWNNGGFLGYHIGGSVSSPSGLTTGARPVKSTLGTADSIYCYFQTFTVSAADVIIYENELNYMGTDLVVGQFKADDYSDETTPHHDRTCTGCAPGHDHTYDDYTTHSHVSFSCSYTYDTSKYSIFTGYEYGYTSNGDAGRNSLSFSATADNALKFVFSHSFHSAEGVRGDDEACSYSWSSGNVVLNNYTISRDLVSGAYHGRTSGRGGANDRRGEWNDLSMPWTWGFSPANDISYGSNPLLTISLGGSVSFGDKLSSVSDPKLASIQVLSHIPATVTEQFHLGTDVDTGWIKGNEALGGGSGIDIQTRVPMIVWVNGMPYPDLTYGVTRNLKMYDYLQVNLEVTDRIFSTDVTELQDSNVRDSIGDDAYLNGHVVAGGSMLSLSGGYTQFAGSVNGVTIRAARPVYYSGNYFDIYHQRLHTVHGGYLEMLPHTSRDQAYDEVRMLIREYDEFIDELSVVYQSAIDTLGECYIGEYVWSGVQLSPVPDAAHEMTRLTPNATVTLNGSARSINGDSKYHFGNLSSAGVNNLIVEDLETDGTVRGLYLGIIFMDGSGGIGGAGQSMSGLVESYTPAIGFISHNPTGSSRMNALAPMVLDTASSWYNAMLLACARGFTVEETLAWRYNAYDTTYMDDIGAFTINSSNYSVNFSANAINNADPDTVWFVNTVLPEYGLNYASAFEQQAGSVAPDDRLPNAFSATPGYLNPTSYWEVDNIDNWLYRTHMSYADGLSADDKKHWYTEYRKPVWMIGVSNTVKVTLPPEAYTVIDPIFQGENTGGVDGMYQGGPDKAWNTYMAAIASPDEVNRKVKLFDWEGTDYWLDLNTLGRSDVVYVSNTNVSDSY